MSSSSCSYGKTISQLARQTCHRFRRESHISQWPAPSLRLRLASSLAEPRALASTSSISPTFFQPNYEHHSASENVKGKRKEASRINKEDLLRNMVWEVQNNIESSEVWTAASLRYPGIRRQQVTLVAVLQATREQDNKKMISLTPLDLLRIYHMMIQLDKEGHRQLLWTNRFEKCSVAYMILLKFAHSCKDARALKVIAREAIAWRNRQGRYSRGGRAVVRSRFTHPRVAAADDLTRLIRNLLVSLAVSQRAKIFLGGSRNADGFDMPSSAPKVTRGDDAITISALMRQRIGAYNIRANEEGAAELLPSRRMKDARSPITHTSRRNRRINRMIEQGKLHSLRRELSKNDGEAPPVKFAPQGLPLLPERSKADFVTETLATALQPSLASPLTTSVSSSGNKDIEQMLSQYKPDSVYGEKMQALLYTYERWHIHLCKRLEAKRTLTSTLWQFNVSPRTATQEDVDAIKQVIPSWLLLSILRLHIETGEKRKAEKVVAAYLETQSRIHKGKRLIEVIPIDQNRVHAITSPITPPNSASLLNGMLRAALTSGGSDCFEDMVHLIDKWCFTGNRFSRYVLSDKIKVESHPAGRSLLPDRVTVSLLLESLRNRKKKFSLGVRLVEAMWSRWGIVGRDHERLDFIEPKMHEVLHLPNQAFVTLMNWALQDRLLAAREKKVMRIQSMQSEWTDKVAKMGTNPPNLTRDEIAAWLNVNKKAKASLSQDQKDHCTSLL